jgi:hypothetical protein
MVQVMTTSDEIRAAIAKAGAAPVCLPGRA